MDKDNKPEIISKSDKKYKSILINKLNIIKMELLYKNSCETNIDFFYTSIEDGEANGLTKFKMFDLVKAYSYEITDFCNKNNLTMRIVYNKYYFTKK